MKQLAFAGFLALASSPAFAETVTIADTVAGYGEATYFDLLKQVIPDLALSEKDATGHLPEGIVHIEGVEATGQTPELVEIGSLEVETVKSGGEDMLWVLANIGAGGSHGIYALLAVFDGSASSPRLLDAKEVDVLKFTHFAGAPLAIGDDSQAMLLGSEHYNSRQSYQSRTLAHLYEGKLQVIAMFSLFGMRSCEDWTTEELTVGADESSTDYWTIDATILRRRALAGQECEDPLDSDWRGREFIAQYVWNSSENHYIPARSDFEELARMDELLY